jgi:hypothetical protein
MHCENTQIEKKFFSICVFDGSSEEPSKAEPGQRSKRKKRVCILCIELLYSGKYYTVGIH